MFGHVLHAQAQPEGFAGIIEQLLFCRLPLLLLVPLLLLLVSGLRFRPLQKIEKA